MTNKQAVLVTGATSGIGKGIVESLSQAGYQVIAAGRNECSLIEISQLQNVISHQLDLTDLSSIQDFIKDTLKSHNKLLAIINCAGIYQRSKIKDIKTSDFDNLYATNIRGPLTLNKELLPHITKGGWCIVLNSSSSTTNTLAEEMGPYVSTQASLGILTKAIRNEYNSKGVRVLSIFPGRTATKRMEDIFSTEGKNYMPELLLQPSDIGELIRYILGLPERVEITDIHMRPSVKSY